jgi:hypothetical protein
MSWIKEPQKWSSRENPMEKLISRISFQILYVI